MLTKKEAIALANALAHLPVGEVLENTDLINGLICLKQIAMQRDPADLLHVEFDCGTENKVYAIKVLRELTHMGLKEAKDAVEAAWQDGSSVINAGTVTVEAYETARKTIDRSDFAYLGGRVAIATRWMVTEVK